MASWNRIPEPVGRLLVCPVCRASVDVLEASQGATTADGHRWIDPASYRCGDCLTATGLVEEVAAV